MKPEDRKTQLGSIPVKAQIKSMEKRIYGQWTRESMEKAIEAYRNKTYGLNECCKRFEIPKPTLKRHLQGAIKRPISSAKKNGALQVLPPHVEDELAQHILNLKSSFFGLYIADVRRLAFQIAERYKIAHKFNRNTKLAGKKWFYYFMERHPSLSIREPGSSSIARAIGFNRIAVNNFFNILSDKVLMNQIDAERIFNVDECGFSDCQNKASNLTTNKGKKRIVETVSERKSNTLFVCCASASGKFVPPMLIFKRKQLLPELSKRAPVDSLLEGNENGDITSELFLKWLQHFIAFVKPTVNKKVILLLDGHSTHTKNLETLELAQANGIVLMQLPGHASQKLQPVAVGVLGPMQILYEQELDERKMSNTGVFTQYDVATLITRAYYKAATVENAVDAFKSSGCWPVNRMVFNDADFAATDLLKCKENLPITTVSQAVLEDYKDAPSAKRRKRTMEPVLIEPMETADFKEEPSDLDSEEENSRQHPVETVRIKEEPAFMIPEEGFADVEKLNDSALIGFEENLIVKLKQLSKVEAVKLMLEIQELVTQARLKHLQTVEEDRPDYVHV